MSNSNNKGGKLALGALIGGMAGYITGIMTAPKSGKQTRQDIVDKAESVKEGAETQLQDAVDELNGTVDSVKSKSQALGAKARQEYDEALVKAKDAQNKANQVLKAVRAGEANDPELNRAVKQARQAAKNLAKYLKS
jgi:gas vesicle protein